jgi:hypothetical protein
MQKVWETTSLAFMLIGAVAAWIRFEPGRLSPEHIMSNFDSRTLDNLKMKDFLEMNLNRKLFNSWDFSMLTLAALYYGPEVDVA